MPMPIWASIDCGNFERPELPPIVRGQMISMSRNYRGLAATTPDADQRFLRPRSFIASEDVSPRFIVSLRGVVRAPRNEKFRGSDPLPSAPPSFRRSKAHSLSRAGGPFGVG